MEADDEHHRYSILSVASYYKERPDKFAEPLNSDELESVRESLYNPFPGPPTHGLGILERLPTELIRGIALNLDILSYFRFRHVNRKARYIASDIESYNLIARHGTGGLRALLRGRLASYYTVPDLYQPLVTVNCALCGYFGGFLYLPTLMRCCFGCVYSSSETMSTVLIENLADMVNIPVGQLHQLLPALYMAPDGDRDQGIHVVCQKHALDTLSLLDPAMLPSDNRLEIFQGLVFGVGDMPLRRNACVSFPSWNPNAREVHLGVNCKGCRIIYRSRCLEVSHLPMMNPLRALFFMYSNNEFLDHFRSCEEAQALYAEWQNGSLPVKEMEFRHLSDDRRDRLYYD